MLNTNEQPPRVTVDHLKIRAPQESWLVVDKGKWLFQVAPKLNTKMFAIGSGTQSENVIFENNTLLGGLFLYPKEVQMKVDKLALDVVQLACVAFGASTKRGYIRRSKANLEIKLA